MLRVPKISSKPNEVSFLSLQQLFCNSSEHSNPNDSILFYREEKKKKKKTSRTLRRWLRQRSHCPVFSPFRSLAPLPSQQNVKYLLDSNFFFFHCFFMSMFFQSCVSGSHCLCLTGRLNVLAFLKTADTATGCHVEKRKKKVLFLWNGGERKKKKSSYRRAPSPLRWWKCVCMCVRVCTCEWVCVSLCQ